MHHDRRNIISSAKHALSLSVTMYVLEMSFKQIAPISVRVVDNAFINDIFLSMTEPNYFVTKPHLVLERWLFLVIQLDTMGISLLNASASGSKSYT